MNAQYGPWSPWSYCDQPCGGGKISRFRQCDSPSADFGGLDCVGASTEVKGCNNHACARKCATFYLDEMQEIRQALFFFVSYLYRSVLLHIEHYEALWD